MRTYLLLLIACLCSGLLLSQSQPPDVAPFYADGQWGYANREGEIVIPVQYDTVGFFDLTLHGGEGKYAVVGSAGKFGVIDARGRTLLPVQQDYVRPWTHYRTKGYYGEYRRAGRTYYFSAKQKRLRRLPGESVFVCGFGLGSECISFTYQGPDRPPGVPDWQRRTLGVRQGSGTALPDGIDSLYRGILNNTILFADGQIAVVEQPVRGDRLRQPIPFDYDRIGFFPCGLSPQSVYPVIKVRTGKRWGLLDLTTRKRDGSGRFAGVAPRYLSIQHREGDRYRVEYAPGRYGWVFYTFLNFVEYW